MNQCKHDSPKGQWYSSISNAWFFKLEDKTLLVNKFKQEIPGFGKQWDWRIVDQNWKTIKSGSCYKLACAKACAERESK